MSENENDETTVGEDHPARTDDDHVKAAEEAGEAGTDGGSSEPGSEATGAGPSGGAPTGGVAGGGDSSATGDGPSGGA